MDGEPAIPGLPGEAAWERSLAQPHAIWDVEVTSAAFPGSVRGRLAAGFATPHIEPKFQLSDHDAFFCIGSCFARVLERQLRYRQLNVTSMRYRGELMEAQIGAIGPNGVNKFTTASIVNELRWSLAGEPFPDHALVHDGQGYRDLQLAEARFPVSLERARERRVELLEYFGRLKTADAVIITLGLVELWYDHEAGLWLNVTPPYDVVRRYPNRFTVHRSDYGENRARLNEALDMLFAYGRPGLRVLLTVSPVPMHRTFAGTDALVENGYGKSTLRAVAGDVARERQNVEYWPAYEFATVTSRERAYAPDQAHVSEAVGEELIRSFAKTFGLRDNRDDPEFSEKDYLAANHDVRAAVAEGRFASGYDHWLMFGRAEGRPLR
ncbi:MAG TPA: GSCFA domain-containing protein [Candidatus Elarobacter sp.]|nr:GSCFA domain-containing protein [Candidatus Elarobacter sp.]